MFNATVIIVDTFITHMALKTTCFSGKLISRSVVDLVLLSCIAGKYHLYLSKYFSI